MKQMMIHENTGLAGVHLPLRHERQQLEALFRRHLCTGMDATWITYLLSMHRVSLGNFLHFGRRIKRWLMRGDRQNRKTLEQTDAKGRKISERI